MAKSKASNIFVWIILGLLFIGLAGFGATSFGGHVQSIGKVGDTDIPVDSYARELQNELSAISAQTGQNFGIREATALGLTQNVLGRVVGEAALDEATANAGLSVGDEEVSARILEIPAFSGIDGQFDREAYSFALERNGLTVAEFEDLTRRESARALLQGAVIGGVNSPTAYVDTLYNWARQNRDVTWARLNDTMLANPIPEPTESDLSTYHSENEAEFTLPEARAITYAWLTPDMIQDSVEVDEETLRTFYDDRIDEYVQAERRLVERLIFGDDAAAQAAADRIEAGEITFEGLVEERGLALADIDLGDVTEAELGEAGPAVFALDGPGVAGPAPSSLGPALYRMNAILAAQETTFEQALPDLRREIALDRARREILDMITDVDDLLAGGATLEEVASETDLELGSIDWSPEVAEGIAAYSDFRTAAAQVTHEDFPEVLTLDDNGIFAVRLDEIKPPALQPLEEVRADVAEAWVTDATARALENMASGLSDRFASGEDLSDEGLTIEISTGIERNRFLEGTPPDFIEALFDLETGEVRTLRADGEAWILRLDAVNLPDPNDEELRALRDGFAAQASQDFANDMLAAFTRSMQLSAGVEINQAAINAIHAQFP